MTDVTAALRFVGRMIFLALGGAAALAVFFGPLVLSAHAAWSGNVSGAVFLLILQMVLWAVIE